MSGCKCLKRYLEDQICALKDYEDFKKHKWYKSEEAHEDVGFKSALQSFCTLPQYQDFAKDFRKEYCSRHCIFKDECSVWKEDKPKPKTNGKVRYPA